ncbi:ATP-dependent DNA ligase [Flindersiella endophytica]
MLAKSVDQIPAPTAGSEGFRYEPKWDGYRAVAICGEGGQIELYSRNDKPLDQVFPEIVGALFAELPRSTVLDGEIVRWNNNRLDFECLQRRFRNRGRARQLAASEPAHFICFDVLETAGTDQRSRPLSDRRLVLEGLFRGIPSASPLQLGMQTASYDTALAWNRDLAAVGVEGIVAKPAASTYQAGQRGAWLKVKRFVTTEAIVGGYTGDADRPLELLLGRYNSTTGDLDIAGRSSAIDNHLATQLAPLLQPAGTDHPWPEELPQHWMTDREPAPYTRVEPTLVVEIRADPATGAGKWRHKQRVFRLRDVDPAEVPLDLDIE